MNEQEVKEMDNFVNALKYKRQLEAMANNDEILAEISYTFKTYYEGSYPKHSYWWWCMVFLLELAKERRLSHVKLSHFEFLNSNQRKEK
mgnify:CR=1 FL=1